MLHSDFGAIACDWETGAIAWVAETEPGGLPDFARRQRSGRCSHRRRSLRQPGAFYCGLTAGDVRLTPNRCPAG